MYNFNIDINMIMMTHATFKGFLVSTAISGAILMNKKDARLHEPSSLCRFRQCTFFYTCHNHTSACAKVMELVLLNRFGDINVDSVGNDM